MRICSKHHSLSLINRYQQTGLVRQVFVTYSDHPFVKPYSKDCPDLLSQVFDQIADIDFCATFTASWGHCHVFDAFEIAFTPRQVAWVVVEDVVAASFNGVLRYIKHVL